eukprot:CAMPEP_0206185660 /NCGR_PEP_ID=MMETSP0166-20121206/1941_1 /ASSEMBLY_ACC=CAM_ASM_000260 /TAXON_ID=95228 /ORGANISM="Vannella robusta, Strain DIVA3 518/3/11/1/6" /LENGTH=351 /DNA_ID=CAMNT_0053600899 /DNA_START=459 /DNA_END=1511 /DNA_ORIENTATION=+
MENNKSSDVRKGPSERFHSCKSYLPMAGSDEFLDSISTLLWSQSNGPHIQSVQTPGGTAAIRMAADTIHSICDESERSTAWVSSPTWGNHIKILRAAGFTVKQYPYNCSGDSFALQFDETLDKLKEAAPGDVVLFQGNCHNPTGLELTDDQWIVLYEFCQDRNLLLLVDMAFVGMSKGVDEDFRPFQHLADLAKSAGDSTPWFFAVSYSKCFTMYNERVGSLSIISNSAQLSRDLKAHVKMTARACYSNPPANGAQIINTLLGNEELTTKWKQDINLISLDIQARRDLFVSTMAKYLPNQVPFAIGGESKTIFMRIGLSSAQNVYLRETFGLYNWAHHFNIMTVDADRMEY